MSYYTAGGKYIRVGNKLFFRIIPTITNYLYNGDFSNASSGWDIVGTGITISSSTGVMNIYGAWNEHVSQLGTTMLTHLEPSSHYVLTFDASGIPTDQFLEFSIMNYGTENYYASNKQFGVNGAYSIKFSTPGTINNQGFGLYFQTVYEGTMDNLFLIPYVGNITVSDDFESYSIGNLSGQGNWVAIRPSYPINIIDVSGDQRFKGSSKYNERCYTRTEAFSVDHYAQCTIESAPDDESDTGVAVRCNRYYDSGWQEQFFAYYGHNTHRAVFYSINGSWVALSEVATTGVSPGDVLRLEVEGNILRAYYNGSLDTVMDNGAIINVASIIANYPRLAEGTPGIATAGNGGSGDNFEAGDLSYTITDNFESYSSGSLDGQGNWQDGTGEGTHVVVVTGTNNVVNGETGDWDGVARRMDVNNANHFAELAITTLGGAQLGVVARSSGSLTTQDYFAYYVTSSSRTLQQVLNRTVTATVGTVASGGAIGDVIRIEAIDMSVYCYRNGRLDASLSGGGVYTIPSGMETGYPGIMSYGSSTQGDNFYAGYKYARIIPKTIITDDFEAYTTGELAGQGNWVVLNGVVSYNVTDVSGDNVLQLTETSYAGNRRSESVSNSQYAQVRIDLSVPSYAGVGVRLSDATTYYNGFQYYGGTDDSYVVYVIDGAETVINGGSASRFSTNDVIRLEVEGTTLRAYKNGVLDTSNGGTGEYDISSIVSTNPVLASGSIGINGAYLGMRIDDFVGGDL